MRSFEEFIETRWAYAALALIVLVLSLPGLMSMPVLDRDEGRFAEASSEMLETGDFVVIRYHDDLRNKKPVGIHWMQAATMGVLSSAQARDIAVIRLPSLLGAMLAAMATLWAGTALFTRRAAFIGAAVLASCLLLTTEAHIAKTDAAQCGLLMLGIAALARMRQGGGKAMGMLFWFCMAWGVLLKGPIAPMVAGFIIVGLLLWERQDGKWNAEWARPLLYWPGISLFVIMTVPWFLAVQVSTQGAFMKTAIEVDLAPKLVSAAEGHKGLPGTHLAALPILFWPGTLLLVPGLWLAASNLLGMRKSASFRKVGSGVAWGTREAGAWRFLACWVVPSWIVFELAPTKLFHYVLPMYPAFALMAGAAVDRWLDTDQWDKGRWISLGLFVFVAVLFAAIASPQVLATVRADAASDFGPELAERVKFIWDQAWAATGVGIWVTLLIGVAALATAYAVWKKLPLLMLGGMMACALVVGVSYRAVVLPNQSWVLSSEAALSALKELCALPEGTAAWKKSGCAGQVVDGQPLKAPQKIRSIAFGEPSFVFALGNKIDLPPVSSPEIPPVEQDNRPAWLINAGEKEGREALDKLVKEAAASDRCIRFARRYATNYSNGDPSILVAAVLEPAGCPATGEEPPELRQGDDDDPAAKELEN
jgi:4-amino-4-deoxy-L-arabinose transferase-like glycosyltransferase